MGTCSKTAAKRARGAEHWQLATGNWARQLSPCSAAGQQAGFWRKGVRTSAAVSRLTVCAMKELHPPASPLTDRRVRAAACDNRAQGGERAHVTSQRASSTAAPGPGWCVGVHDREAVRGGPWVALLLRPGWLPRVWAIFCRAAARAQTALTR